MRRILVLLAVITAAPIPFRAQALDAYGGLTAIKCKRTTRSFHTEKLGNQWWMCTPLGHAFFLTGVYVVAPSTDIDALGNSYYNRVAAKYGDPGATWAEQTDKRLQAWGFNTLGTYSSLYALPTNLDNSYPLDSLGLHSHPTKLPFVPIVRPAYYSMSNPAIYTTSGTVPLLADPVKNMMYAASSYYTGYNPWNGVADYYDGKLDIWLSKDLSTEVFWTQIKNSPYLPYMIGINCDDGDQMWGFGAGDAFPTNPAGHNNAHLGWIVATLSPVQTANAHKWVIYWDTTVYTKNAWRDALRAKYGTIAALNSAWGSNYTTFDSSGTAVSGEAVGSGDGVTLVFAHTLAHLTPSRFSVQVQVAGTVVGGDTGDGNLYGPNLIASTINYTTGLVSVTFTPGHAPAGGAAITVSYVANGWEIGSGLLDEDGRPAHQAWLGSDFTSLSNTNPNLKADLSALLKGVSGHYFNSCRAGIKAVFPNTLYLGPDSLGTWSAPSRAEVLQSAASYLDVMVTGGMSSFTQAMMDYVAANYGDKPYFEGEFRTANADSALLAYSDANVGGFPSQAARGQDYYTVVTGLRGKAVTGTGSQPYVGSVWWQFADNWAEHLNWGLVTSLDNAYDGTEAVVAAAACSAPLQAYTCGGEVGIYGNAVSNVKSANLYWLSH